MQIERTHSWRKVGVQCLLLAMPTIFFAIVILYKLNEAYIILQNQWLYQGIFFLLGIFISLIFYGWRFRFTSTIITLGICYFIGYQIIEKYAIGEFDMFFFIVQYLIFLLVFSIGWLVGFGFSRWRFFTVIWILFLLAIEIILISKIQTISAEAIIITFAPVLLYAFYILYASELVRNLNEHQSSFSWFLAKRVSGFFLFAIAIFAIIFLMFRKDLMNIEHDWNKVQPDYQANKSNSQSMTKSNHDGTLSPNGQMPLSGSLSKTKQLVFVARLNNFFADGKTQNPLYFTADYYTRFDTVTQTFETDSLMPFNDLFKPDPSKVPLFFTKTDSLAIKNSQAIVDRSVVEAEIYKVALSPSDFLAPNTAFSVQPIPVPREYGSQYSSAYRAKMWVSSLNSAYFVYNPAGNTTLEDFQKMRFDLLRKDTSYLNIDTGFLQYYTSMPRGKSYQKIVALANQITLNDSTVIDKMLAIRNYFLSKDEFGQPLFKYTDNPGVPGLPSANKLDYFLFENRKGYCAYFAGATLFLLRSLGIPSRIATGFLTVDRSSKNPGWYWFYEDQAHAWVQVFFPGYGWIDFDTTVPDMNTQQAPQPDGTPPLGTQKVYFVGDGIIKKIDSTDKKLTLYVGKILYRDKSYTLKSVIPLQMNIAFARIATDTGVVSIGMLKKGAHISAASYNDRLNNIDIKRSKDTAAYILSQLKEPVAIDEVKIIDQSNVTQQNIGSRHSFLQSFNWQQIAVGCLVAIAFLLLLILLSPWLIWQYYQFRAKKNTHWSYRATLYYLNQLGYSRKMQSPESFAMLVDKKFSTNFSQLNRIYQKEKYSKNKPSAQEQQWSKDFFRLFIQSLRKQIPWKQRTSKFFNLYYTLNFFIKYV